MYGKKITTMCYDFRSNNSRSHTETELGLFIPGGNVKKVTTISNIEKGKQIKRTIIS